MSLTKFRDTEEWGPFRPAVVIRSPITCDITIISLLYIDSLGLAYTEAPSYMYMPANVLHLVRAFRISPVRLSSFSNSVAQAFHMFKNEIIASITHLGEEIEGVSKTIHFGPREARTLRISFLLLQRVIVGSEVNRHFDKLCSLWLLSHHGAKFGSIKLRKVTKQSFD